MKKKTKATTCLQTIRKWLWLIVSGSFMSSTAVELKKKDIFTYGKNNLVHKKWTVAVGWGIQCC